MDLVYTLAMFVRCPLFVVILVIMDMVYTKVFGGNKLQAL